MDISRIYDAPPASAGEILENREARVARQRALLSARYPCLVSFSMNIPGPVKQFPLARQGFLAGLTELRRVFPAIGQEQLTDAVTGSEALLALPVSPLEAKQRTVQIEETHPLGRLFDMDVLDGSGVPVSRTVVGKSPRRCLLCGGDAKVCSRSRAHAPELLRFQVGSLLSDYVRGTFARRFTACVTRAMLHEVAATPKPGLVDRSNAGSHTDMDFATFMDSAGVLSPWFTEMFCVGWDCAGQPDEVLFDRLRAVGQRAEDAMFTVTGGINTHKGLLFSFCVLCGVAGFLLGGGSGAPLPLSELLSLCRALGQLSLRDFSDPAQAVSNGQTVYRAHALRGVRGELADGFPSVFSIALPTLERYLHVGYSINDAAALTLLALIAQTDDTNMIHRGGLALAWQCKAEAAVLEKRSPDEILAALPALDAAYQAQRLSPGGCADLLSLSLADHFALADGLLAADDP